MRNEIAEHLNFSPQARAFGLNYGEKSTGRNDQGSHPALPLPEVGTILGIRSMTLHDHLVFDRRVVSQKLRCIHHKDDLVSGRVKLPYHPQPVA